MSRFTHLMQEELSYRRLVGTSATGSKTYDPPRQSPPALLKGRLEWQRRRVINDRGEEALSEAVIFTAERLRPGDLIVIEGRDWPVKAVSQRKGLYGGVTDHWEVRL